MSRPVTPLRERFYPKLALCPDPACGCDCLLWTGCTNGEGYGVISVAGRTEMTHRLAWRLEVGPIPAGLQIDHVKARGCMHRHCACVAHLEPVTPRVNTLRSAGLAAINAVKTRCDQGHLFDVANTYWTPRGKRDCRACRRAAHRRWEARRRQIAAA